MVDIGSKGKPQYVSRGVIDETAFSLGPAPVYGNGTGKKTAQKSRRSQPDRQPESISERRRRRPQPDRQPEPVAESAPAQEECHLPVVVKAAQFVSISKEELLDIHRALQSAADATQRLLVRILMERP